MTSTTDYTAEYSRPSWFERSETWPDHKGNSTWIAAMVLDVIFFWPVGIALHAYMIWNKKVWKITLLFTFNAFRGNAPDRKPSL